MGKRRFAEAEEASPTPGSRRRHVTVSQIEESPDGTATVVATAMYNYKSTPPGEGKPAKKLRHRVNSGAKQRAYTKFDPEAHEAQKAKRRKSKSKAKEEQPAEAVEAAAAEMPVAGAAALPAAGRMLTNEAQRDWEILNAYSQLRYPAAVCEALRMSGVLDESTDEWTALRVQERYDLVCRSVRIVEAMVNDVDPVKAIADMKELLRLVPRI